MFKKWFERLELIPGYKLRLVNIPAVGPLILVRRKAPSFVEPSQRRLSEEYIIPSKYVDIVFNWQIAFMPNFKINGRRLRFRNGSWGYRVKDQDYYLMKKYKEEVKKNGRYQV